MAFLGFLCVSEYVASTQRQPGSPRDLKGTDIILCYRQLWVTLRTTKGSRTAPVVICLGEISASCCAVRAYSKYFARLRKLTCSDSPAFLFSDGLCLTRQRLNEILRHLLGSGYTSHSFRSGAATTAADAGFSSDQIKLLGR